MCGKDCDLLDKLDIIILCESVPPVKAFRRHPAISTLVLADLSKNGDHISNEDTRRKYVNDKYDTHRFRKGLALSAL